MIQACSVHDLILSVSSAAAAWGGLIGLVMRGAGAELLAHSEGELARKLFAREDGVSGSVLFGKRVFC